jgi:hypothetical protein
LRRSDQPGSVDADEGGSVEVDGSGLIGSKRPFLSPIPLGLGQIAGTLVVTFGTDGSVAGPTWAALERLVRGIGWSVLVMLASGVLLEYVSGGGFHESWWFRISFFLLLVIGAINGTIGRALRKRNEASGVALIASVRGRAWAMCAVVAIVTFLMKVKPW